MSNELVLLQDVKPHTKNHTTYFDAIKSSVITLCLGTAGTGKTYMACYLACKALAEKKISKVILTRPMVTCGEEMGFLPGDSDEKFSPYVRPLLDAFDQFFDHATIKRCIDKKQIEMIPLGMMRGMSLSHSFIICDEAQNATYKQLRMLLTRIGDGSKMVVTGDTEQSDIEDGSINPLITICERFQPLHKDVSICKMTHEDIMRHGLIRWIEERLSNNVGKPTPIITLSANPEGDFVSNWREIICQCCQSLVHYDDSKLIGLDDIPEIKQVECCICNQLMALDDGYVVGWDTVRDPTCVQTRLKHELK